MKDEFFKTLSISHLIRIKIALLLIYLLRLLQ